MMGYRNNSKSDKLIFFNTMNHFINGKSKILTKLLLVNK